jgi:hypothetical protein
MNKQEYIIITNNSNNDIFDKNLNEINIIKDKIKNIKNCKYINTNTIIKQYYYSLIREIINDQKQKIYTISLTFNDKILLNKYVLHIVSYEEQIQDDKMTFPNLNKYDLVENITQEIYEINSNLYVFENNYFYIIVKKEKHKICILLKDILKDILNI